MKKRARIQDPKSGHGGRRKNAGRPPSGKDRLNVSIAIETKKLLYNEARRLDQQPGELVDEAIQQLLPAIRNRKPAE